MAAGEMGDSHGAQGPSDPPGEALQREVGGWAGVTVVPHRFGGVEFRVGRVEFGHLPALRLRDATTSSGQSSE
jgi:hypothetical protein